MKKEEKITEGQPKPRPIYRYELQATNQILKDTQDLCHSSVYSTARTNKPPIINNQEEQIAPQSRPPLIQTFQRKHNKAHHPKSQKSKAVEDFCRQKNEKKLVFQEFGYIQNSFDKELQPQNKNKKGREPSNQQGDPYFNSQYFSHSSQNNILPSNKAHTPVSKSVENSYRKGQSDSSKKQIKKQRRGLAEISLKVKNIVSRRNEMSYKQVSDQVLKESQQQLPTNQIQREKQTKNIRRRVYDALNVLVSVQILGKKNRNVVNVDATNVPGKKLSQHWHIINEKNRILEEKQKEYEKKVANLNLLKKNIEMVQLFHNRNKKINEVFEKKEESTRSQVHQSIFNDKYLFPLVFLIPPRNLSNKIKIQLEYEEQNGEQIKKITIDNNDYILTDLDVLKYLNLTRLPQIDQPFLNNEDIVLQKVRASQVEKEVKKQQQNAEKSQSFFLEE